MGGTLVCSYVSYIGMLVTARYNSVCIILIASEYIGMERQCEPYSLSYCFFFNAVFVQFIAYFISAYELNF